MMLKNLLAITVASAVSLCSQAAPTERLNAKTNNQTLPIDPTRPSAPRKIKLTGSHPIYRMITFGDSLSDIGNTQLLLEVMNREANAELIFKPFNKTERFLKILAYFNLSLKHAEKTEEVIADVILDVLHKLVTIPIFPDSKYYNGPSGHKTYGRFSNGPVWSEWLGQMLLGNEVSNRHSYINRAYGGSWGSESGDQKINWTLDIPELVSTITDYIDGKLMPPDMHYIISAFLDEYPTTKGGEVIGILYGANDYMNNDYSKPDNKANPRVNPARLVSDMQREITRLADWAAESADDAPISFIYVSNLPDISKAPRYIGGSKKGQSAAVLADIEQHNHLLEKMVANFQQQDKYHGKVEFRNVDIFTMFNRIYDTLPTKNKTEACYPNNMIQSPLSVENARKISKQLPIEPCKNPGDYFFWDVVHPTAQVHAELSYNLCLKVAKDIAPVNCFKPDWKNEQKYPDPAFNP